ncbi:MAG: S-layer homology domain-containing protein [Thermotogae bacterium]|nr:S-layer homology domain-containing protein [Thermotogota bacterium]
MRVRLRASLIFLMFIAVFAFATLPFKDVPPNHWAYDAVKILTEAGVLSGMPDGTFQGNKPLTRYQAAVMLKRLLDYISKNMKAGGVSTDELGRILAELEALKASLTSLSDFTKTNRDEISNLKIELENLRATQGTGAPGLKELEQNFGRLELKVGRLETTYSRLDDQMKTLASEVASVSGKLKNVEGIARSASVNVETLAKKLTIVESKVENINSLVGGVNVIQLEALVHDIDSRIGNYVDVSESLKKVKSDLSALESAVSNLSLKSAGISNELKALKNKLSTLESNIPTLSEDLKTVSERYTEMSDQLANVDARLATLEKRIGKTPWVAYTDEKLDELSADLGNRINTATVFGVLGMVLGAAGVGLGVYLFLQSSQ